MTFLEMRPDLIHHSSSKTPKVRYRCDDTFAVLCRTTQVWLQPPSVNWLILAGYERQFVFVWFCVQRAAPAQNLSILFSPTESRLTLERTQLLGTQARQACFLGVSMMAFLEEGQHERVWFNGEGALSASPLARCTKLLYAQNY